MCPRLNANDLFVDFSKNFAYKNWEINLTYNWEDTVKW